MKNKNVPYGVAILAGGGSLPLMAAARLQKQGLPFHLLTFSGQPVPEGQPPLSAWPHTQLPAGALGKLLEAIQSNGFQKILMVGAIQKPSLFDLRPDAMGLKFLAQMVNHHDDTLLDGLCSFFATHSIETIGVHEILPELCTEEKIYCGKKSVQDEKDIALGWSVLSALGVCDIGQAVVVKNGVVLGVEAVEGTNGLIERCAVLRGKKGAGGWLLKRSKPGQNLKIDMPTVGAQTLQLLAAHKYKGLALQAGKTLFLDQQNALKIALKNKMTVVGCCVDDTIVAQP